MKLEDLTAQTSLKAIGREVGLEVQMVEGQLECTPLDPDDPRYCMDYVLPSMKMVEACRAEDFEFFQPWIATGRLTVEQMHRAAARYHLGKTRSGQTIFWMIDEMRDPQDAHIAPDTWISTCLKRRQPLLRYWRPAHCLFGLHLLGMEKPVAIVESEASAVVLSELFPESLWMAHVTMSHLEPERFAPLQGRAVTFYPRTDLTGSSYLFFEDFAAYLRQRYNLQVTVVSLLEDHATDQQKERGIDILGFILDHELHRLHE